MTIEERLQILKKIEGIAALAGLRGSMGENGEFYGLTFETNGGRSQSVYVRPSGHDPEGRVIVTIYSPAAVMPKGIFKGLGKAAALELLQLNGRTPFARFGIWDSEKETLVVASLDALLDTLDADELKAYAYCTAFAADAYESRRGGDRF